MHLLPHTCTALMFAVRWDATTQPPTWRLSFACSWLSTITVSTPFTHSAQVIVCSTIHIVMTKHCSFVRKLHNQFPPLTAHISIYRHYTQRTLFIDTCLLVCSHNCFIAIPTACLEYISHIILLWNLLTSHMIWLRVYSYKWKPLDCGTGVLE